MVEIEEGESEIEVDKRLKKKKVKKLKKKTEEGGLTLSLINYDEDSATFSWNRSDDSSVVSYEIHSGTASGVYDFTEVIENDYSTKGTVNDLEEGVSYYFELIATDEEGAQIGGASTEIVVTTAEWLFEDVSYLHESYDAIATWWKLGFSRVIPMGPLVPKEINRAELLKILIEGREIDYDPELNKNCFPDVSEEWFARICVLRQVSQMD